MKNSKIKLLFVLTFLSLSVQSLACSNQSIDNVIRKVDPYYSSQVAGQFRSALNVLSTCENNLFYGGEALGKKFDPYYSISTQNMATVVITNSNNLHRKLKKGLGFGIISKIDPYYSNATVHMSKAVFVLGKNHPRLAKKLAMNLLKKDDPYYSKSSKAINSAVNSLLRIAKDVGRQPGDDYGRDPGRDYDNSKWVFRSRNQPCGNLPGPWGEYELCPTYYATGADHYGNRITLVCDLRDYSIKMRIKLTQQAFLKAKGKEIVFRSDNYTQSLGVPYVIKKERVLVPKFEMDSHLLSEIKKSYHLELSNGFHEYSESLRFSLNGSSVAVNQLQSFCY